MFCHTRTTLVLRASPAASVAAISNRLAGHEHDQLECSDSHTRVTPSTLMHACSSKQHMQLIIDNHTTPLSSICHYLFIEMFIYPFIHSFIYPPIYPLIRSSHLPYPPRLLCSFPHTPAHPPLHTVGLISPGHPLPLLLRGCHREGGSVARAPEIPSAPPLRRRTARPPIQPGSIRKRFIQSLRSHVGA